MKLAVHLVHYHTPRLLCEAWAALARDAAASGLELEGVVVDNGSHPEERAILAQLPLAILDPGENLGYAGAINLAVEHTRADDFLVMNPDVLVEPGCLAALLETLAGDVAVAGPCFFWDRGKRFRLPPTERRTATEELLRLFARRDESFLTRLARRRWRRHAWRHWLATEPLPSYELSGALLAIRRSTWTTNGPFDPGYRLYFEETDWLERLRAAGQPARYVPGAEAIHLYAQSTLQEPQAAGWFAASSRRFRRRHYGRSVTRLLEQAHRLAPDPASPAKGRKRRRAYASPEAARALWREDAAWLEISPEAAGFPAAARRLPAVNDGDELLSWELWESLPPGSYALRTVAARGQELSRGSLLKQAPDLVRA